MRCFLTKAVYDKMCRCASAIARQHNLAAVPKLYFIHQAGNAYKSVTGLHSLEAAGTLQVFPPGYYGWFNSFKELFKADYFQLNYELDQRQPHYPFCITLMAHWDGIKKAAAYKWFYVGKLKQGERFCVIFYMYVAEDFRRCGLSSLLKMQEICVFQSLGCDFIQTYLEPNLPHFMMSLVPNLQQGFLPWPNIKHREELYYQNEQLLHLRKYLKPGFKASSQICFQDGACFVCPAQNQALTAYLSSHPISQVKIKSIVKLC